MSLSSLSITTDTFPTDRRFAAWQSALQIYDADLPLGHHPHDFAGEVNAWDLSDLVVTQSRISGANMRRTADRIRSDGVDAVKILLLKEGTYSGEADGQTYCLGPGQVVAHDLARPFTGQAGSTETITISAARTAIDRSLPSSRAFNGKVLESSSGKLLAEHMLALVRFLPIVSREDVPQIVQVTLAHIVAALMSLPHPDRADPKQGSIFIDARRYIDRHLGAANLSPGRIATDLGITRSSLYRSFEMRGGVSSYIQERMLHVLRLLLADTAERRPIAELAETFGFASAAHFSTSFRRRYGVTPREYRATKVGREDQRERALEPADLYRKWMQRLS